MSVAPLANSTFNVAAVARVFQWLQQCAIDNGARRTPECARPGLSVEALVILSKTLGFEYRILWARTYDELEQAVLNGSADFTLNFLAATPERWSKFTFLPPLNFLEIGFVNRQPRKMVKDMPIFRPFDTNVWLCLIAIFVAVVILISGAHLAPFRIPQLAFELYAFSLKQNGVDVHWRPKGPRVSMNILISVFAVFLLLVQTFYSSILVSILCPIPSTIPFTDSDSLARLITSGKRRLFAEYPLNSLYFSRILNSTLPGHVRMQEAITKNPPVIYKSENELPIAIRTDRSLVSPMTSLTYAAFKREFSSCSIKFIKDRSLVGPWESIVVRKDFPHSDRFQRVMKEGMQNVIYQIARRDYYHRYDEAPCQDYSLDIPKPTHLAYLAEVFQYFGCGLGLAFVSFLIELVIPKSFQALDRQLHFLK